MSRRVSAPPDRGPRPRAPPGLLLVNIGRTVRRRVAAMAGSSDFDLYRPREEHDQLREAIRALADGQDRAARGRDRRDARVPARRARRARRASDFHAIHVPEEYGGAGGDALAACIVIEEVARVCASSLAHPRGEQARLAAADPRRVRRGEAGATCRSSRAARAMFSYALSEPEAGSDAGGMTHQGGARRRRLGAQRREALDHQRGRLGVLHGHGAHRSREAHPRRHHGVRGGEGRRGLLVRRARAQARHPGQPDPRALLRQRAASPTPAASARSARASRSRCRPSTTRA